MKRKRIVHLLLVLSTLVVVGCGGGSSSDGGTTPPTEENTAPIADAGVNQIVTVGTIVTLDGSGSSDSNGIITDYTWTEGAVELSHEKSFDHNFTLGTHIVTLRVTDDDNATDTDDVVITVTDNLTLDDFPDVSPPDTSFETEHFIGSQNCAQCHDDIHVENNTSHDVSIVKAWQGTMMDSASIDPLYLAKVASEVQRNPEYQSVIEEKCSRCHMPMANVEAGFSGDPIAISGDDGFLNPQNAYYDAAKGGVSCTLCHQIEDSQQLGTFESFSGGFVIADNNSTDRKIYGPYKDDLKTQPMINNVQFTPEYSAHMNDSKLCATCHNLDTPVVDIQTNALNGEFFPEQAVYTEWEYSDFNDSNINTAQSCQACHMPTTEGSVIISTKPDNGTLSARSPFYQHKFIGANTYMLDILKDNREKLGSAVEEERFEETIESTKDILKAAADLNISTPNFSNDTLDFRVMVTNHSGHKFPTSIPTRRVWLHVKVTNSTGQTLFESGAWDSGTNKIIGVDDGSDGYESHYTDINDSSQVQVYEAIMADTNGDQTYTLMNAASFLKDNRILPKGYKNNTPAEAQPYGMARDDSDFIGGSDTVHYSISGLVEDTYTISVTLKYQTASYGFMQDLYKDVNLMEVALMKVLDQNTENHFEDISKIEITYTPE